MSKYQETTGATTIFMTLWTIAFSLVLFALLEKIARNYILHLHYKPPLTQLCGWGK